MPVCGQAKRFKHREPTTVWHHADTVTLSNTHRRSRVNRVIGKSPGLRDAHIASVAAPVTEQQLGAGMRLLGAQKVAHRGEAGVVEELVAKQPYKAAGRPPCTPRT